MRALGGPWSAPQRVTDEDLDTAYGGVVTPDPVAWGDPAPLRRRDISTAASRSFGGPWSAVAPDGTEAYRYGDLDDACSYARERARSTGQPWRVVDGLRGPRRGPGPLPAGVRVVAEYP